MRATLAPFEVTSDLDYHCSPVVTISPSLVVMKPPYEISETGWGEFEVVIKIFFADPAEKPVSSIPLQPLLSYLETCPLPGDYLPPDQAIPDRPSYHGRQEESCL